MDTADLNAFQRIVESSPVIVLLLSVGLVALWRKLDIKDQAMLGLQRETLIAMTNVTTAVTDLKETLQLQRPR